LTISGRKIRIGTRGSLLARTQTEWVAAQLRVLHPGLQVEIEIIQTTGDLRRDVPFAQVGTKGMFVKEIEQALLDGTIDLGIHSLKDMPGEQPDGLGLVCIPKREDPRDALLTRDGSGFDALPHGAIVGTSSIRRQAQLLAARPDLKLVELRGNLDTRLRKLDDGQYQAIVLACAGLNRLGLGHRISEALSPSLCVPAVGQGALALEIRTGETVLQELLMPLQHEDSAVEVEAERGFQSELAGGCTIPAGALATVNGDMITLISVIAAPDGSESLRETMQDRRSNARQLGIDAARRLLDRGGREYILENINQRT